MTENPGPAQFVTTVRSPGGGSSPPCITVDDVSGQDRMVLVESNWQVCSTDPVAGTELDGQPVTIGAVKFGESC